MAEPETDLGSPEVWAPKARWDFKSLIILTREPEEKIWETGTSFLVYPIT